MLGLGVGISLAGLARWPLARDRGGHTQDQVQTEISNPVNPSNQKVVQTADR